MLLKIATAFFLFVGLSIGVFAKDNKAQDLLVVASEHPLLQYQENGENKGPTIEILNGLLKETPLRSRVSFMPWARAFATVKHNPNTLILSMIRTPDREPNFHWLIKVSQSARVFISLASKPENYVDNFEQAKNRLIAVRLGSAAQKELLSHGFSEHNNLYIVSSDEQMIHLLANGRIDLVYTDPNNVLKHLESSGNANIAISHKKIVPKDQRISYIALNKNTDIAIVQQLQNAARKFEKTAEYRYLLAK